MGTAGNGVGSTPGLFRGYHGDPVPMPNTNRAPGGDQVYLGQGSSSGVVTRELWKFTKIAFESTYKKQHKCQVHEGYLLTAKDKRPDKDPPRVESYSSLIDWLGAFESYLLRLVSKRRPEQYLFPEELENEIVEELIFSGEGADTKRTKFGNVFKESQKVKLRRLRITRRSRWTLTCDNLTIRLYEVYRHAFVRGRAEMERFMQFRRRKNEPDIEVLQRYVQEADEASVNLFPNSPEERNHVWEVFITKVPDFAPQEVHDMMVHTNLGRTGVPHFENVLPYMEYLEGVKMMHRRGKATEQDGITAGGARQDDMEDTPRVAAASARTGEQAAVNVVDPKSRYSYNAKNKKGNFGG
ncbi:unnamed protein product, partial [Amoebophrya sp. A25]|eukprot:GSA25T00012179001.1